MGSSVCTDMFTMRDRGGAVICKEEINFSSRSLSPSASITTPCASLRIYPKSRCCFARRKTKGRNPTPCTIPSTRIFRRSITCYALSPAVQSTIRFPHPTCRILAAISRQVSGPLLPFLPFQYQNPSYSANRFC